MRIYIKSYNGASLPKRGSRYAAGWDIYNNEKKSRILWPFMRHKFSTGLAVALPDGTFLKIESRSGLAFKKGLHAIGGIIDEDYRGEIGVILVNSSLWPRRIKPGERIAQAILHKYEPQFYFPMQVLPGTERGDGGFGHTGK